MSGNGALVVPIDVRALCVGVESDQAFAAIAADFAGLPWKDEQNVFNSDSPFVANRVFADPFQSSSMHQGVHLHWALPDALAHGGSDGKGGTVFPPAPNRWLVVRVAPGPGKAGSPGAVGLRAWVIESDQLWDDPTSGSAPGPVQNSDSRTVPVRPAPSQEASATGAPSRRLGRVYRLEEYRPGTDDGRIAGCAYAERLTALGYGMLGFAAAFPHCPNVFGFRDDGDGLPSDEATLSYAVIGWFAGGVGDPLAPSVDDKAHAPTELGWGFEPGGDPAPHRTVCAGLLRGVRWRPNKANLSPPPYNFQAGAVDVVIGQTIPEAVAALLAGKGLGRVPSDGDAEHMLLLFQLGLLERARSQDSAAELAEACHLATFGAEASGTTWVLKPANGTPTTAVYETVLAAQLAQLNLDQTEFDGLRARFLACQRQMFADWHQVISRVYSRVDQDSADWANRRRLLRAQAAALLFDKDVLHTRVPATLPTLAQVRAWTTFTLAPEMWLDPPHKPTPEWLGGALRDLVDRRADLNARVADLRAKLGNAVELAAAPAPVFFHPAEPVILLSGDIASLSSRHGGDGADEPDRKLRCRLPGQLVSVATSGPVTMDAARLLELVPDLQQIAQHARLPPEAPALVVEAMLLDPIVRERAGATAEARFGSAILPSATGLADWSQPWLPLLVQWEVGIEVQPAAADTLASYSLGADHVELFRLNRPPVEPFTATGQMILTGKTEIDLRRAVQRYRQLFPDDPNAKALEAQEDAIGELRATALTLSGFNAHLLMRDQALQLPPADPAAKDRLGGQLHELVPLAVGAENAFAPLPDNPYSPIRAGAFSIKRLRIVDAFGQYCDVIDTKNQTLPSVSPIVAEAIRPVRTDPDAGNPTRPETIAAELPPRLVPSSRLLMRWLAAGDVALPQLDAAVTLSPICGWILFNHLDVTLDIYAADGTPLGALDPQAPACWTNSPGLAGAAPGARPWEAGGTLQHADPELRAFVQAAIEQGPAFLRAMIEAIDLQMTGINPLGLRQDQGLSLLIGRPIALVRASLRLEIRGLPPLDQSANALATAADAYSQAADGAGSKSAAVDLALRNFSARSDRGVAQLRVPFRLGDLGVLEDGVVGYFLSEPSAGRQISYSTFYASAAAPEHRATFEHKHDHVTAPDPRQLTLSPCWPLSPTPDRVVAMLIDPRGAVHATVGILPVAEFRLPPSLVSDALRRIAVSFLTAPILAPAADPALPEVPVPEERGWRWDWMIADPSQGDTPGMAKYVAEAGLHRSLLTQPSALRILEGWLRLRQA